MKVEFKFTNGQKVKDTVSGMTGIINGAAIWLNGCKQYSVQPPMIKGDSKKPSSWWIDEAQLTEMKSGFVKIKPKDNGGPSTEVQINNDPIS